MYQTELPKFLKLLKKWGQTTIGGEDGGLARGVRRRGPKPRLALKQDVSGFPLLPPAPPGDAERLDEVRDIFRAFVTQHYRMY